MAWHILIEALIVIPTEDKDNVRQRSEGHLRALQAYAGGVFVVLVAQRRC
jgi:hypothetical protein